MKISIRTTAQGLLIFALLCVLIPPAAANTLLLDPGHGGGGAAWGLESCAGCHPLHRLHRSAPRIRGIVEEKGYGTCTGCHGGNGSGADRACVVCHNAADLPAAPRTGGLHRHDLHGTFGDVACVTCHQGSDMDGVFDPNRDLTPLPDAHGGFEPYYSISDFCLRCHNRDHQIPGFEMAATDFRDPLIAMEDNEHFVDLHGRRPGGGGTYSGLRPGYGYPARVACSDCHAMHGTDNPGLLIDSSANGASQLDPVLRLSELPVWVDQGSYAELCVLCHQMDETFEDSELNTGNGLAGVHQAAGDCRPCHGHGQAGQAGL